jgi:hypothetical protein
MGRQLSSAREAEKRQRYSSVAGYSPDSNDVITVAEESSLLEAVASKRLEKTEQDTEGLACSVL